jgi:GTP-binding protein Era
VERLQEVLASVMPESEAPLFPADVLTDQAEKQLAAEYVREQLMQRLEQELPYAVGVEVESFDESDRREDGGLVRIAALIRVERDSQKAIVIGKKGAMLKEIGTQARLRLERLLGCKVFLGLTVKVDEKWTERPTAVRREIP